MPLTTRLKDILEPTVDEKYYLSEKMVAGFISHAAKQKEKGNGFKFEPITNTNNQIAKCVTARVFKVGSHDNYIDEKTTENQIAKCITTEEGSGGYNNFIKEVSCGALRGRDPENSSNRETGANLVQTLEINKDGVTNTITTVQKDNVIIEPAIIKAGLTQDAGLSKGHTTIRMVEWSTLPFLQTVTRWEPGTTTLSTRRIRIIQTLNSCFLMLASRLKRRVEEFLSQQLIKFQKI